MEQSFDQHDRPITPSFHPIAGVKIELEEIHAIAALALPNSSVRSVKQLGSGKSFNNRIYFITVGLPGGREATQEVVLRLIGRFFGANKIQNEVACLQLVHKYCPHLPVPRVLAWSEDGTTAAFPGSHDGQVCLPSPGGSIKAEHGGWIMQSRVPGTPLDFDELDDGDVTDIAAQLGDILISIRLDVPAQKQCGNVRLPLPAEGSDLIIKDIVQEGITVDSPMYTPNDYYRCKILGKVDELETNETHTVNRGMAPAIRAFVNEDLPKLVLRPANEQGFVLTHYDLAPRNVLVGGDPPRITGLVDFEFSGFFPLVEEFLNYEIGNKEDWPGSFWSAFLDRLEVEKVATPRIGIEEGLWKTSFQLETLVANIAPWDLPGGLDDEQLAERLAEAKEQVIKMLKELKKK